MTSARCAATLLISVASALAGQIPPPQVTATAFSVSRADAGPARTELGYGIVVNKESSLHRQALTVHDTHIPGQILGDAIVRTVYADREYDYKTSFNITATDALSAVEVRVILFDVFGARMKVLSATEVVDVRAGGSKTLEATWRAWENEVSEYLASLAFVARVRTQSGQVINAELAPVLAEANKFSKKLTAADLEPSAAKPPNDR